MAMLEFVIHCRVPEDPKGTLVPIPGIKLPNAFVLKLPALRSAIQQLKSYSRLTNAGKPYEENTIRATWRICHHDEGDNHPPCEAENEI